MWLLVENGGPEKRKGDYNILGFPKVEGCNVFSRFADFSTVPASLASWFGRILFRLPKP